MRSRASGMAGLLSFALLIAGGLTRPLWDVPGSTATGRAINGYVGAHRTSFLLALVLYGCGVSLWFWLFAAVARRVAAGSRTAAAVFSGASTGFTVMVLVGFVPMLTLAYRAPSAADEARTLYDLSFGVLATSGFPTAVALLAYAVGAPRASVFARLTRAIAVIAAAAHLLIVGGFFVRTGFLSLEGLDIVVIPATLFLWILLVSVAEIREPPPRRAATSD